MGSYPISAKYPFGYICISKFCEYFKFNKSRNRETVLWQFFKCLSMEKVKKYVILFSQSFLQLLVLPCREFSFKKLVQHRNSKPVFTKLLKHNILLIKTLYLVVRSMEFTRSHIQHVVGQSRVLLIRHHGLILAPTMLRWC